jgi:hypothetical protein
LSPIEPSGVLVLVGAVVVEVLVEVVVVVVVVRVMVPSQSS